MTRPVGGLSHGRGSDAGDVLTGEMVHGTPVNGRYRRQWRCRWLHADNISCRCRVYDLARWTPPDDDDNVVVDRYWTHARARDLVATENTLRSCGARRSAIVSEPRMLPSGNSSDWDDGDGHESTTTYTTIGCFWLLLFVFFFFFLFLHFLTFSRCVRCTATWRRRRSLCLRGPTVVGRVRAEWNRSGPCACAGGGGARPIGWLLPCAVAGRGPIGGRPRRGNRRSNRFPLIENSCCGALPAPRLAYRVNDAPQPPPPTRGPGDQRGGKRAKNRILPRAAARAHAAHAYSWFVHRVRFKRFRSVRDLSTVVLSGSIPFLLVARAPPSDRYDCYYRCALNVPKKCCWGALNALIFWNKSLGTCFTLAVHEWNYKLVSTMPSKDENVLLLYWCLKELMYFTFIIYKTI